MPQHYGNGLGLSFQPGATDGGSINPVQTAIKLLSLRLPDVVGPNALAPQSLLTGQGGGAIGGDAGLMLLRRLLQLAGGGVPQQGSGGGGGGFLPRVIPGAGVAPPAAQGLTLSPDAPASGGINPPNLPRPWAPPAAGDEFLPRATGTFGGSLSHERDLNRDIPESTIRPGRTQRFWIP